ncbi:DUF3054 domain-containing protein [Cryobacterium algoritolerans]|uniref:DUF3054 domain-containing protein n=1 Tax=Cryobacterium algoritolerans TaxID=1259184 RepID=A0A4R8WW38_9MICO|nr:DUF3054 domain-containing protein [Cryobacterium algoritolerans]TFC17803.1 DUF3054 domain-containing protein [Cryobacterium algoritolerans]
MTAERAVPASVITAASIDAGLVLVFVLIGRASHDEGLLGVLTTWWPFLGGLAIGWILLRAWRSPGRIVWTGIGVWLCTVAVGMLLRLASGQGVQPSFIVVATIVLGVFLLGWRAIALLAARLRRRASGV